MFDLGHAIVHAIANMKSDYQKCIDLSYGSIRNVPEFSNLVLVPLSFSDRDWNNIILLLTFSGTFLIYHALMDMPYHGMMAATAATAPASSPVI